MKIEMGESLCYSWLRHVKECRIVQLNWKPSPQWDLKNEDELTEFMQKVDKYFQDKHNFEIFKQNKSLSQLLQQSECDVIGISNEQFYAIDVAFHSGGLNYGAKETTIMKVLAKSVRSVLCFRGFMDTKEGEILFISPKIHHGVLEILLPCIEELNTLLEENGYHILVRIVCNDNFKKAILDPVLLMSDGVADTSELFMRSYQMISMFPEQSKTRTKPSTILQSSYENPIQNNFDELKIGQFAQATFKKLFSFQELETTLLMNLQSSDYSKQFFDLNLPLLVSIDSDFPHARYYSTLYALNGSTYRITNDWYERCRPYLLHWLKVQEEGGIFL